MGRNRDLNGNNVIDKDEIRWYLASIDQLTDLWIGEDALPDAAKLYDVNTNVSGNTVQLRHVASSSLYAPDNVWVIWAEEGASRGSYGGNSGSLALNALYATLKYRSYNLSAQDLDYLHLGVWRCSTARKKRYASAAASVPVSSISVSMSTRRWWRPPSYSASSHSSTIILASSEPTTRAPNAMMLVLLCMRLSLAV